MLNRLVGLGIVLAAIYALIVYAPNFLRLRVGPAYDDIEGLDATRGLDVMARVPIDTLALGDAVAFKLWRKDTEEPDVFLGWAAAFPGDEVGIERGRILVNGRAPACGAAIQAPSRPPAVVPAGHVFVVSSRHRFDSTVYGPIPQAALLGRLRELP